jgi:hypothetical protein
MSGLFVRLQYLLPHHLLCRLVYALTRSRVPWLKNFLITAFMRGYRPPMAEALEARSAPLPELQCLLHPRPAPAGAPDRSGSAARRVPV